MTFEGRVQKSPEAEGARLLVDLLDGDLLVHAVDLEAALVVGEVAAGHRHAGAHARQRRVDLRLGAVDDALAAGAGGLRVLGVVLDGELGALDGAGAFLDEGFEVGRTGGVGVGVGASEAADLVKVAGVGPVEVDVAVAVDGGDAVVEPVDDDLHGAVAPSLLLRRGVCCAAYVITPGRLGVALRSMRRLSCAAARPCSISERGCGGSGLLHMGESLRGRPAIGREPGLLRIATALLRPLPLK